MLPAINVTDTTYKISGLTPESNHTIVVTANSANSCPPVVANFGCKAVNCPTTNITLSIPDTTICLNANTQDIDINATITGGLGIQGIEFWDGNGVDAMTGLFDPQVAGIGQHSITLVYTEDACVNSVEVLINLIAQPISTFTGPNKICVADPLMLAYTGSLGVPLDWNLPSGATVSAGNGANMYNVNFNNPGIFTIGLISGSGSCISEEKTLNVQVDPELDTVALSCTTTLNSISYTWNDIDCASEYEIFINGVSQGFQTALTFNLNNLNEGDKRTIRILPKSDCACPAIPSTKQCEAKACPKVDISLSTPQNNFCFGDVTNAFNLNASLTGSEAPGIGMWSGTSVNEAGLFNPQGLNPGTYELTYDYLESNCPFDEKISITILPNPILTVTATNPDCYLDNFGTIVPNVEGGNGSASEYILDGNAATTLDFIKVDPGQHILVVRDQQGCDATQSFTIQAANPAVVNLVGTELVIKGKTATVTANVTQLNGATVDSVVWKNSVGQVVCPECLLTLSQVLDTSDQFCATIYYNDGCNIEDCIEIRVNTIIDIVLPNVIQFDADGNSEFFIPQNYTNIASVQDMSIFDRWGNKVFSGGTFDPKVEKRSWNGTLGSQKVLPGVYVYKIELTLTSGRKESFEGDVTVVR
jgi:hypothetical protein